MRIMRRIVLSGLLLTSATVSLTAQSNASNWPAFRGDGTSQWRGSTLPTRWSAAEHVAWRVTLGGHGQSSPVTWRDRVFVTAVTGTDKARVVVASYRLRDGVEIWRRDYPAARRLADTDTTSKAASTPIVDASRVYTLFESGDVIALTHEGEVVWRRSLMEDYGEIQNRHQYGSSPILAGDTLIVLVGHQGPSYLIGLDVATGRTRWKSDRPSVTTWASPTLARVSGRAIVIVPSKTGVDAYDVADGRLVWAQTGVSPAPIASPTAHGSLVIVASGARSGTGAVGVDGSRVEWLADEVVNDFSSPLVHGGLALFVNSVGVVQAVDVRTGRALWRHRLPGPCWASAISDGTHAYFFTTDGTTVVMQPQAEGPQVVSENQLPVDGRVYGVAPVDGGLVIRTDRELWRMSGVGRPVPR
jgi:outer membrane protein assembly factor BamB